MLESGKFVPPEVIARWFVNTVDRDSGDAITHLKLQKMVFYAQAWFLAHFDRPLFEEDFEAWVHGPVCKSLFQKYRNYSWEALPLEKSGKNPPQKVKRFLANVYEEYGKYSAKALEKLTHDEDPWKDARKGFHPVEKCSEIIPKLHMRNYYASLIGKEPLAELN